MNSGALKISLFMACLLPSLFFAQGASAEYYQWRVSPPGQASRAFPDPYSACEWGYTFISTNWSRKIEVISRESVACKYSGNGLYWEVMYASLRGTECPDNGKYDEDARMCKTPPPECESGTPNLFRSSNYPIIVINGKNTVPSSPPSGCLNGCAYEADSSRPQKCFRSPGSETEGFCNYLLKTNGQNCSTDSGNLGATGPSLDDPSTPDPDPNPDPNDPGCPKGYSWSGTTCVKTPTDPTDPTDPKDPGGDGGGTGGGDGGGTGGGTGGGGDGGTGGGDGGTGGGDGNGGTGGGDGDGGGTGGGGDGGGDGQCDPAKDPNKCGSGSSISGDGDCKVAIQCNGDAIQCAIVRQEKASRCADEEFRTVDDKKIQDLKNTLAGEFSGPEYEPIKATGENTHDLSRLLDTSGRFSKACPVIPDFSFPWFGSTQTVSLSSVSSDLCTYLQWFGYLLVAFAMRAAAEIIARGLN
ncbi:attachment protein [Pseudomonas aeruginosa]|nr:attachment protein [Pseudomonas aeruginosa]MDN3741164.1 attachment protein [Pseudomonas aeruginosa]